MKALLNMHLDPEGKKVLEQFGAQRFIETRNEDYDIVRNYAAQTYSRKGGLAKRPPNVSLKTGKGRT
jgi:ABC-type phosphate/phosphonate transport system substrate-binding protein